MLPAELPIYWNGLPFRAHQVGRKLHWLLARGEIRQLIAGLYVDVRVRDTVELRADALRLVVPPNATVCGRAAAWLHGIDTTALSTEPFRPEWTFAERPAVEVHGLMVTTPAATAIELAKHLPRPFALSAVDGLLHAGMPMSDLTTASAAYFAADSTSQAAQLLRIADGRAESPGESWLRLRLFDARFPRPELQVRVEGNRRTYRLDLGYPDLPVDGRRLGLEYDSDQWHSSTKQQLKDETRRTELDALGWHIISVRRTDLWGSYPALELAVGAFLCQHPRLPRRW
jgi:very-short-patch-repair endonuclease